MVFIRSITMLLLLGGCQLLAFANPHGPPMKAPANSERPCGFKIAPCPSGTTCVARDPSCPPKKGENCAGTCKASAPATKYKSCGGFRVSGPATCNEKAGEVCIDDPVALAQGSCGMACDRPGICVIPQMCGGFAGFACKDPTKTCYDDPRDDCDPKRGGADCSGLCI